MKNEDGIMRQDVTVSGTRVRWEMERKEESRSRLIIGAATGGLAGTAIGLVLRFSPHARLAAAIAGAALHTALKGYRFKLEWDPTEEKKE